VNSKTRILVTLILLGTTLAAAKGLWAADWPAYRHDLARSGVTEEALSPPLHPQWVYTAAHPPRPAWPEPGRELNRLAFDYAYEVTAAGGLVYFGSSADHKVYAIRLDSGRQQWSFFTEGPVRFAPAIEAGRVFACSDDGRLYCLSAADGALLWRFQGGPRDERMFGNQQMISRWPARSGVAVDRGVVYFSAGMWPNEGVYFYALDAEKGKVLWKNETSGIDYRSQPHPPSVAVTGVAPQGYVSGHEGQLFLPTGRNVPAAYDRHTGELLYYHSRPATWGDRWGGCWNMLSGGLLFGWRCHVAPDTDVRLDEFSPHKDDGIVAFDAKTGNVKRDFPSKRRAVVHDGRLYMSGSGKVDAYDFESWVRGAKPADCTKWSAPHDRAYAMILAGSTLVVGGQDTVTAIAADTGRIVWQDQVEGQARSLAVADGRLLVSTTTGQITCYGPEAVANPPVISSQAQTPAFADDKPDSSAAALARRILDETGKRAGYCLLLGAGDGRLLYELTKQSELKICCLEPNAEVVASTRRMLDKAKLYGVRAVIHHGSLVEVAYPECFADLIILCDGTAPSLKRLPAEEVYRVLRPCGGIAHVVADGTAGRPKAIRQWLMDGQVPAEEITTSEAAVQVVRGTLPGAGDWTHQYASATRTGCSTDQRVRLPLKLLWFGEPGPARMIARHWKGPAPLCVDGRMFVIGQYSLMAVDAYNGRPLWRRDLPKVGRFPSNAGGSNVAADEDSVYVAAGNVCLRLDAATGETADTYELPLGHFGIQGDEAKSLVWSYLAVGANGILGTMGTVQEGSYLFLIGKAGRPQWTYTPTGVVGNNAISMDQRSVYLIERTSPDVIARAKKRGESVPASWKLVALDAATGKVAWETEDAIAGRTELWLAQGVLLATGGGGMSGYEADTGKPLYSRSVPMRRFPVIVGACVYGEPAAYDLRTGTPMLRKSPFAEAGSPWSFSRSYGCGSISGGRNLLLFRSGTLGMYDLAGDSGVHNFGGVRAGCHVNAIAAGGLVLMPPGDASCSCSYCFQTTIALAPTHKQENWSVFYDQLPNTPVRRAALNLGAPGDQRDPEGVLWLATPRPETTGRRRDIAVPFRLYGREGCGAYRLNADNVQIAGTDRPWIYTSCLKGPVRAELDLEILDRAITSWPADEPPAVDGQDGEPCWDGYKAIAVARENASVTLRHDDQNLYLAFTRPAAADSTGKTVPWKRSTTAQDGPIWKDDSFELFLSGVPAGRDAPSDKYLHVGVSASGARYDALWTYVTPGLPDCNLPRLEVTVDGEADDWADQGIEVVSLPGPGGTLRAPNDFDPCFRLGWSERGIFLLAQVKDNVVRPAQEGTPLERGDCVEVFVTPKRGSSESYRLVIAPGTDPGAPGVRSRFDDYRKATAGEELRAEIAGKTTPEGYLVEMCLPWENLKITPGVGVEFGLQLFAGDDDGRGEKYRFRALWHPAGDPRRDPLAYQTFHLAAQPSPPIKFTRSEKPDKSGLYTAVPPHPFPVQLPPLGAEGEDASYAHVWSSDVNADERRLVAELAVPWKTLTQAGFNSDQLMVNLSDRGPLREPPVLGRGFERLIAVPRELTQPKTVSVRLHFAELEDAKPGERVFDVKLQDRVVLEDFDITAAAGGRHRAVVRQFDGIVATRAVTVELLPTSAKTTSLTAPTLCGIEIVTAAEETSH
jgi:outer membrane protein assembly factor BamB